MRSIYLLLIASVLASCAAAPQRTTYNVKGQERLAELTAGKVAGQARTCLPSYRSNDMVVIDENTIAFRDGSRVWVNHMQGGCSNLRAGGPYALVTKSFGGMGMCRGDIAQVADVQNGFTVGSCVFGDFVPYVKPGTRI